MRHFAKLIVLAAPLLAGCMSVAVPPQLGLERNLYPGLAEAKPEEIPELLDRRVDLRPPVTAGIAWLRESTAGTERWGYALSDYQRAGIIEAAVGALQKPPLSTVSVLPTVSGVRRVDDSPTTIDGVRSAAAKFQSEIAIVMQTGIAETSGFNPLAIGYAGLITALVFPGTDYSVASSAELCAVDVRSGIMLGCGIGRDAREARWNFPWGLSSRREEAREESVRAAVRAAAEDLHEKVSARLRD